MEPDNENSPSLESLTYLRDQLRIFASERDWEQFHSPKNLAMALIVEVAEILEHFQWMTEKDSYLTRLADVLGIDPLEATISKVEEN